LEKTIPKYKIQSTEEKKHILAKGKKNHNPTKQPDRFTLQAWRAMSKVTLCCCLWHYRFRCPQSVTSDLQALAFPQVTMHTGLWKVIKLLE